MQVLQQLQQHSCFHDLNKGLKLQNELDTCLNKYVLITAYSPAKEEEKKKKTSTFKIKIKKYKILIRSSVASRFCTERT